MDRPSSLAIQLYLIHPVASPRTLKRRPRVAFPTGTLTAAPVSIASAPLSNPSVGDSDTQRTQSLGK